MQGLLRERVSVRDQETILETLAVHAARTKDIDVLIERVRRGLARRITQQYLGADGRLRVATLARLDAGSAWWAGWTTPGPRRPWGRRRPGPVRVAHAVAPLVEAGHPPIVLCSAEARPVLKDLTRVNLPRLVVLSQREIPRDTPVETLGTVAEDEAPSSPPSPRPPASRPWDGGIVISRWCRPAAGSAILSRGRHLLARSASEAIGIGPDPEATSARRPGGGSMPI